MDQRAKAEAEGVEYVDPAVRLAKEEEEMIFYKNALRLLGIKRELRHYAGNGEFMDFNDIEI